MDSKVNNLILLQSLDEKLAVIERAKGDLPARVTAAKAQVAEQESQLASHKEKISETQSSRRSLEGQLELIKAKQKDYQEKLYAVTTNKEYDAVVAEIDTVTEQIDKHETEILQLIEEEETLQTELGELEKDLAEVKEHQQTQESELNAILAQNAEMENKLLDERETLIADILPQNLRTYERIRKGRDGLAMVRIVRGACSGCYTQIPPQRVMEVRMGERLYACESCGRLLFWEEEPEMEAETAEAVEA